VRASKVSSSRRSGVLHRSTLTAQDISADRQHVAARYQAEMSVIRPSLQIHLLDFGQGSTIQLSAGDDVQMDDATDSIPLAPFEEAEGDVAFVEAVRQAVTDHRQGFRQHKDHRTRRDRLTQVHANWTPFLMDLADAYIAWKARASMKPSSPSDTVPSEIPSNMSTSRPSSPSSSGAPSDQPDSSSSYDFTIATIDIYTLQRNRNIHRTSDMKTAVALMSLVMPKFGSEPKFEPELLRTGPKSSSKFRECLN